MDEKKSLTDKYRKINIDETEVLNEAIPEKPKKEKKAKKEKAPKEKKAKEPKQPKEKKEKTPKEKKVKELKPPKEKKAKEPKPPKPEKVKKEKTPKEKKSLFGEKKTKSLGEAMTELSPAMEDALKNLPVVDEIPAEITEENTTEKAQQPQPVKVINSDGRIEEEIVLPVVTRVKRVKQTKKEKQPKDKKEKEPKEKNVKEPKPEKVKKEKAPKPPKEIKPREPMTGKDFVTIGIALVAVALACTFVYFRFFYDDSPQIDTTESSTETVVEKLSDIQITRNGVLVNLVQTDIPDVFYGITTDYKVKYYQYRDNRMVAVQSTGSIATEVDFGNESLPVTIDYVRLGGKIYGIGLFIAEQGEEVYFYNMMVFKLTNLPSGYEKEGKALLLATTSKTALTQGDVLWPESFTIDLESGKTSRFLKIINRSIDMTTGAGVTDFCILTQQGYNSTSGVIPFITAREYEQGSGMLDIFVKDGTKENLFAENIYGKFLLTDGDSVIFMRKTNKGFDVIRKTGKTEDIVRSFYGSMGTDYLHKDEYLLNVNDGNLYNMLTGEKTMLVGFRMDPEMMAISNDGKYVVMLGTVKNMMDYQVHVFNLETGEYAKFEDQNYSSHGNLTFINNTTAVYTALDPNQGYEYVVMDVSKIK